MKKLTIMRGIPGCGKSTYVRTRLDGFKVYSADDWFMRSGKYEFKPQDIGLAHQNCFRRFIQAVQHGESRVAVDNTNTHLWEMSPYILAGDTYGYEIEIVEVQCDPTVAAERGIHGVPAHIIQRMADDMTEQTVQMPPWWTRAVVQN